MLRNTQYLNKEAPGVRLLSKSESANVPFAREPRAGWELTA
jgi:hypothetical protein